ncbi:nucleotide-binding oligomerization domain-containing protein 2 [Gouania willdenowi]|uniref:Nucleotide-binding oligomerization domain-containing protein 2 n=1 Tax=Gouania willdenowi TaxID=441366 RepID=A0A8C5E0I6_GOUWI|nr:nucleotide-binding oligomerization domain-containing protein 2 [Gouania willdenowi]XP_028293047.1 nucleotide-binding oligomerization domain-containing protein 2 [Gouania willdenowi]XP_028293058.1 nucleotide-binding oligomerization domain-containing protein 2 [Gouania willdenowi]XP_028293065.1 nucleotide-binding oligomerization domain-containing protein 2 [Gouania willdenowi]
MNSQEIVLKYRAEILNMVCSHGSSELLETILDFLLSQEELNWEDYRNILITGRALYPSARQLLDLVYSKGEDTCGIFLATLKQILPEAGFSFLQCCSDPKKKEASQGTCSQRLVAQRPAYVYKLQGCIDGALKALLEANYFTPADCNDVQLPIHTSTQQARRLLDHVRAKGEPAAEVILQYIQQKQESDSHVNQDNATLSKEFLKYQKKLRSSVSAHSCFLSSYGGTSHMSLEDVYTEGLLELPQDCNNASEPLSINDIFHAEGTMNEEADTVLVSGEAGIGKTTLLQRLHTLWAQGAALQNFLLLFPFNCRRLNSEQRELSVQELLFQHCCWPDREQEEIFSFILDHPHLILFTFDGLDELKHSFSDEDRLCCPNQCAPVHKLLFNLIQGSLMKGVLKLVTSRPQAVNPVLKRYLRKEILLKGFSPTGIDSFLRKNHSDPAVAAKVLHSLQANTALLGLCHSPVLCWILSQCYKELLGCEKNSIQTTTDIYLMILQHFLQRQTPLTISMKSGWLKEHLGTILHLGQLAFRGITTSMYIFLDPDLKICKICDKDICSGFLLQSKNISSTHIHRYEFPHVTMQCFFAALYIVLSTNADSSTIHKLFELQDLRDTGPNSVSLKVCLCTTDRSQPISERKATKIPNLQITAMFVSGLLSQRHQSLWLHCSPSAALQRKVREVVKCLSKGLQKHFRSIPPPVQEEKKSMHAMPDFVWLIKCIYEMQESRVAKDAMSKLEVDHLKLTYCNIGPIECTALAYVLQHLKNPIGLQLDNNSVGDVGVEQLLPCMHICRSLYLRNNNITDEGIRKLIAKGIQCDNFQKIALFNNKLTNACTQHFHHLLKNRQNFLSIRLGNNAITAEGAKQLAVGLKANQSLQYLGLWGNKIGDTGAEALASALEGSKTLVWLSLVDNNIGSTGACALAKILRGCPSLKEIWLTENCITKAGVACLVEALEGNTHVESVWLRKNHLTLEEEEEMRQQEKRLVF